MKKLHTAYLHRQGRGRSPDGVCENAFDERPTKICTTTDFSHETPKVCNFVDLDQTNSIFMKCFWYSPIIRILSYVVFFQIFAF